MVHRDIPRPLAEREYGLSAAKTSSLKRSAIPSLPQSDSSPSVPAMIMSQLSTTPGKSSQTCYDRANGMPSTDGYASPRK